MASPEAPKIIFSMIGVSKKIERKEILRDISLSFYYGAKIGVLGLNGSGKSSLMRILAGIDNRHRRPGAFRAGLSVGFLPQEPALTPVPRFRACVEEGVKRFYRFEPRPTTRAGMNFPAPRTTRRRMRSATSRPNCRRRSTVSARGCRSDGRAGDGRAALSAGRRHRGSISPAASAAASRWPGCCCRSRRSCCSTSRPTILTPTASIGSSSISAVYEGTVIAVTHDRYFLDNVAGWILELDHGHGLPFKGNYSSWLEQKQAIAVVAERTESKRQKAMARELVWIRQSAKAGNPRVRRASMRTRRCSSRTSPSRKKLFRDHHPAGPAARHAGRRGAGGEQSLRRQAALR